ncbi:MAG: BufA2 family periplasmic bufferin-type metallophore [bacterium]
MKPAHKVTGLAVASAAALLLSGCSTMDSMGSGSSAKQATVHCMGVNSCKGQTACNTANNACKGQNACKGKGWLPMTKSQCEAKGGTV